MIVIEPFPQEIRERLTEMREIDLHIHSQPWTKLFFTVEIRFIFCLFETLGESDKLDNRVQVFFQQCKRQKPDWRNENFDEIKKVKFCKSYHAIRVSK